MSTVREAKRLLAKSSDPLERAALVEFMRDRKTAGPIHVAAERVQLDDGLLYQFCLRCGAGLDAGGFGTRPESRCKGWRVGSTVHAKRNAMGGGDPIDFRCTLPDERRVRRFLAKHPDSSAERVIVETGAMPSLLLAMLNAQRLAGGVHALTLRRQRSWTAMP